MKRKYSFFNKKSKYGKMKRGKYTPRKRGRKYSIARSRITRCNVHSFKRWVSTPTDLTVNGVKPIAEATGGPTTDSQTNNAVAMAFKLSDVVNASEFDTLYDRYKITRIQLRIHLVTNPDSSLYNGSTATSVLWQSANTYPRIWYCPDYDDNSVESIEKFKQRATTKSFILRPNKDYKIWVKPATLVQAYRGSVTTTYEPKWGAWVDMSQNDTPYYGWRCAIDSDGAYIQDNYPFKVRINALYYFTCKDVR